MRKQKGFSLIELLIVVAIILIIAAIAIPNLLRAKISANESSAVGSVRNIVTQEIAYSSTYQDTGYAPAIIDLGPVAGQPSCLPTDVPAWNQACLIDGVLALGVKSGYGFEAIGNNSDTLGVNGGRFQGFGIAGVPVNFNQSGTRDFCAIEDGVVRANAPIAANTGGQGAAATLATAAEATCVAAPYAALQ